MAQYKRRPLMVEAEQFDPESDYWPAGVFKNGWYCTTRTDGFWCTIHLYNHSKPMYRIDTLEGGRIVSPGDWIITDTQGERYLCKPDIFNATYEAV